MENAVHAFQNALLGGGARSSNDDDLLQRLIDTVYEINNGGAAAGKADIAGLVRQCLLRIGFEQNWEAQLRVPSARGWPSIAEWERFGCSAEVAGPSHLLLQAIDWRPAWLGRRGNEVVDAAVSRAPRRALQAVPIDPVVLPFTDHKNYSSNGQRAAVRAAFLMPAGSTLIVNLPTGAGKSLVFQLPTLVYRGAGVLTVVVVPTVALARDQERRFSELHDSNGNRIATSASAPLAYHSGLSRDEKSAILAAVRGGSQSIVFASPESIMGALRGPLFQAAEEERLRYFVIDEAHLITQWGQQFRPEFQSLAGLRDSLRNACPTPSLRVRTLLLTATLTQECYDTVRFLFGASECQLVGELSLRTEPGYIIHHASAEQEREENVIDAVRHLPRPLIVYTTLPAHAEEFLRKLQTAGFRRIRMVRGGDMAAEGAGELLRQWQAGEFDIVVATSAFGLGVDHSGVRAVIHACLPETVDRYYQEVGRAGRDGRASVAVLSTAPADRAIAESLAKERLISVDRGFERWVAMWSRRTMLRDGTHIVSLSERPSDIDESGPKNVSWNLRTLMLMVQAGLIRLLPHKPPQLQMTADEAEEHFDQRRREALQTFIAQVVIDIQDSRHSSKPHWDSVVANTRSRLYSSDRQSLALVMELLNLTRPLNELFREIYTLTDPDVRPPYVPGSCPITRDEDTDGFAAPPSDLIEFKTTESLLNSSLHHLVERYSDTAQRCWVLVPSPGPDRITQRRTHDDVLRCLTLLVHRGISEVATANGYLSPKDWDQLRNNAPLKFIARGESEDDPFSPPPPLHRVTVLPVISAQVGQIQNAMSIQRPTHIILFPDHAVDPRQQTRRLCDMVPHCSLEEFISRLGQ